MSFSEQRSQKRTTPLSPNARNKTPPRPLSSPSSGGGRPKTPTRIIKPRSDSPPSQQPPPAATDDTKRTNTTTAAARQQQQRPHRHHHSPQSDQTMPPLSPRRSSAVTTASDATPTLMPPSTNTNTREEAIASAGPKNAPPLAGRPPTPTPTTRGAAVPPTVQAASQHFSASLGLPRTFYSSATSTINRYLPRYEQWARAVPDGLLEGEMVGIVSSSSSSNSGGKAAATAPQQQKNPSSPSSVLASHAPHIIDLSMWSSDLRLVPIASLVGNHHNHHDNNAVGIAMLQKGPPRRGRNLFLHQQHLVVRRVDRFRKDTNTKSSGDDGSRVLSPYRRRVDAAHTVNRMEAEATMSRKGNGGVRSAYPRYGEDEEEDSAEDDDDGDASSSPLWRRLYTMKKEMAWAPSRNTHVTTTKSNNKNKNDRDDGSTSRSASALATDDLLDDADDASSFKQRLPPIYSALFPVVLSKDAYELKLQNVIAAAVDAAENSNHAHQHNHQHVTVKPPSKVEVVAVPCPDTHVDLSVEGLCFVPAHITLGGGGAGAAANKVSKNSTSTHTSHANSRANSASNSKDSSRERHNAEGTTPRGRQRIEVPPLLWTIWSTTRSDRYVSTTGVTPNSIAGITASYSYAQHSNSADHDNATATPPLPTAFLLPNNSSFYMVDFSAAHHDPTMPLQAIHIFDPLSPNKDLLYSIPLPWHLDGLIALKLEGERRGGGGITVMKTALEKMRQQQRERLALLHQQKHQQQEGGGSSTTLPSSAEAPLKSNHTWQVLLPNIDGLNGSLPKPFILFSQRAQRVFTIHSVLVSRHTLQHVLCVWRLHSPFQLVEFIVLPTVPWGGGGDGGDDDGVNIANDACFYRQSDPQSVHSRCGIANECFAIPEEEQKLSRYLKRVPQPIVSVSLRSGGQSPYSTPAPANDGGGGSTAIPSAASSALSTNGELLYITFHNMATIVYTVHPPMSLNSDGSVTVRPSVLSPVRTGLGGLLAGAMGTANGDTNTAVAASAGGGGHAASSSSSSSSSAQPLIISAPEVFGLLSANSATATPTATVSCASVGEGNRQQQRSRSAASSSFASNPHHQRDNASSASHHNYHRSHSAATTATTTYALVSNGSFGTAASTAVSSKRRGGVGARDSVGNNSVSRSMLMPTIEAHQRHHHDPLSFLTTNVFVMAPTMKEVDSMRQRHIALSNRLSDEAAGLVGEGWGGEKNTGSSGGGVGSSTSSSAFAFSPSSKNFLSPFVAALLSPPSAFLFPRDDTFTALQRRAIVASFIPIAITKASRQMVELMSASDPAALLMMHQNDDDDDDADDRSAHSRPLLLRRAESESSLAPSAGGGRSNNQGSEWLSIMPRYHQEPPPKSRKRTSTPIVSFGGGASTASAGGVRPSTIAGVIQRGGAAAAAGIPTRSGSNSKRATTPTAIRQAVHDSPWDHRTKIVRNPKDDVRLRDDDDATVDATTVKGGDSRRNGRKGANEEAQMVGGDGDDHDDAVTINSSTATQHHHHGSNSRRGRSESPRSWNSDKKIVYYDADGATILTTANNRTRAVVHSASVGGGEVGGMKLRNERVGASAAVPLKHIGPQLMSSDHSRFTTEDDGSGYWANLSAYRRNESNRSATTTNTNGDADNANANANQGSASVAARQSVRNEAVMIGTPRSGPMGDHEGKSGGGGDAVIYSHTTPMHSPSRHIGDRELKEMKESIVVSRDAEGEQQQQQHTPFERSLVGGGASSPSAAAADFASPSLLVPPLAPKRSSSAPQQQPHENNGAPATFYTNALVHRMVSKPADRIDGVGEHISNSHNRNGRRASNASSSGSALDYNDGYGRTHAHGDDGDDGDDGGLRYRSHSGAERKGEGEENSDDGDDDAMKGVVVVNPATGIAGASAALSLLRSNDGRGGVNSHNASLVSSSAGAAPYGVSRFVPSTGGLVTSPMVHYNGSRGATVYGDIDSGLLTTTTTTTNAMLMTSPSERSRHDRYTTTSVSTHHHQRAAPRYVNGVRIGGPSFGLSSPQSSFAATAAPPSLYPPNSFAVKATRAMGKQCLVGLARRYWALWERWVTAVARRRLLPTETSVMPSCSTDTLREDEEETVNVSMPSNIEAGGGVDSAGGGVNTETIKQEQPKPKAVATAARDEPRSAAAAAPLFDDSLVPKRGAQLVWEGIVSRETAAAVDRGQRRKPFARGDENTTSVEFDSSDGNDDDNDDDDDDNDDDDDAIISRLTRRGGGLIILPMSLLFGDLFDLSPSAATLVDIRDGLNNAPPQQNKRRRGSVQSNSSEGEASSVLLLPMARRLLTSGLLKDLVAPKDTSKKDHDGDVSNDPSSSSSPPPLPFTTPAARPLLESLMGPQHYAACRALVEACRANSVSLWLAAPEDEMGSYNMLSALPNIDVMMLLKSAMADGGEHRRGEDGSPSDAFSPSPSSSPYLAAASVSYGAILRRLIEEIEVALLPQAHASAQPPSSLLNASSAHSHSSSSSHPHPPHPRPVITNICGLPNLRKGYKTERHTALLTRFYAELEGGGGGKRGSATTTMAHQNSGRGIRFTPSSTSFSSPPSLTTSAAQHQATMYKAAEDAEKELIEGLKETILVRAFGGRERRSVKRRRRAPRSDYTDGDYERDECDEDDEDDDPFFLLPPTAVLTIMPSLYHVQCLNIVVEGEATAGEDNDDYATPDRKAKRGYSSSSSAFFHPTHTLVAPTSTCSDAFRTDLVEGLAAVLAQCGAQQRAFTEAMRAAVDKARRMVNAAGHANSTSTASTNTSATTNNTNSRNVSGIFAPRNRKGQQHDVSNGSAATTTKRSSRSSTIRTLLSEVLANSNSTVTPAIPLTVFDIVDRLFSGRTSLASPPRSRGVGVGYGGGGGLGGARLFGKGTPFERFTFHNNDADDDDAEVSSTSAARGPKGILKNATTATSSAPSPSTFKREVSDLSALAMAEREKRKRALLGHTAAHSTSAAATSANAGRKSANRTSLLTSASSPQQQQQPPPLPSIAPLPSNLPFKFARESSFTGETFVDVLAVVKL